MNNACSSRVNQLNKSEMSNGKNVEDIVSLIAKIGEKITIGRNQTIQNANSKNFFYQHSIIKENVSKLGVIVSLEIKDENEVVKTFGKQLSMHIAATNPLALKFEEIEKDILDKEQELIAEELKNSGKPDEIAKKISFGKLKKFKEENSLMTQDWVIDPKKNVQQVISDLKINDLKITEFVRMKIGE